MHQAVALLEDAAATGDPAEALVVTQRAIASAIKIILQADDSSGIIGGAIRELLGLHATLACRVRPPVTLLVEWMIKFQFESEQDIFELDPTAYAPALGERGIARYRARLAEIAERVGPTSADELDQQAWKLRHTDWAAWERSSSDRRARSVLEHNAQRLAVLDQDVEAIIATHARDRKIAAWLQDTAEALAEIGKYDLAIDWAKQATDFDSGHQSQAAANYWCALLGEHRPDQLLAARKAVFDRWPTASIAADLYRDSGPHWAETRDTVMATLAERPREAVMFALYTLDDLPLAWSLAHSLGLDDRRLWLALAEAYEQIDASAVLPIYHDLVLAELEAADAKHYRSAARRLARMRTIVHGTDDAASVDALIADLRDTHRRRPRLQREFDRAHLP